MTALVAPPPWKDATLAVAHCYRDWPILPTRWPACIPACAPRLARAGMERRVPVAGPPCGPRWRRPAAESAVQGARPRAAPAQQHYLLDRAEDSFIAMVAAADLLESNAPRWLGRNAGAHLCHALHRYASGNAIAGTSDAADAPGGSPARTAGTLRRRSARTSRPASRTRPSWPASFRCWTGCNSPPSPSGRPLFDAAELPAGAASSSAPAARGKPGTCCARTCDGVDALRYAGVGRRIAGSPCRAAASTTWMSLDPGLHPATLFRRHRQRTVERAGRRRGRDRRSLLGLLLSTPLSVALAVADRARHVRRAHGELRPVHVLPTSQFVPCSRSS